MSACVASGENLKEAGTELKASCISMKMSVNCFRQTSALLNHDQAVSVSAVNGLKQTGKIKVNRSNSPCPWSICTTGEQHTELELIPRWRMVRLAGFHECVLWRSDTKNFLLRKVSATFVHHQWRCLHLI